MRGVDWTDVAVTSEAGSLPVDRKTSVPVMTQTARRAGRTAPGDAHDPLAPFIRLLARRAAIEHRRRRGMGMLEVAIGLLITCVVAVAALTIMGGGLPR